LTREESTTFSPPQVHLPEDEGAHPKVLFEWWYGNFTLMDSSSRPYGAMVAYFNAALRVLSISDLEEKQFYHEASFSKLYCAQRFLDLRWGSHDRWFHSNPDALFYHLQSHGTEIGLNLDLVSQKPPLLASGNGLIRWPFGSSYYYSLTRIRVKGQIELSGATIDVEGMGWMDHQWMDFIPAAVIRSYEWFSIQLDNNTEIVFWQAIRNNGSIVSRPLTIIFPDNSVFYTDDFLLQRMQSWVSPGSGCEYGILWRVQEDSQSLDLEIKAAYPEQEIKIPVALPGFYPAFWEGRTTVSGQLSGRTVSGIGYTELFRPHSSRGEEVR
jgi:predicted secreted hydrolase